MPFSENVKCGDIRYGRQTYDYQEGTVTSFAPGQVVEVEMQQGVKPNAHGLLFHPDLIKGTSLGQDIKHYSFFRIPQPKPCICPKKKREYS